MLTPLIPHASQLPLQEAVQAELQASHLYRHLAAQMKRAGYFGAAKYFQRDSAEELTHYELLVDYLNDRGVVAETPAVTPVTQPAADLNAALQEAYKAEVQLGQRYEAWYQNVHNFDVTTAQFLLQFLEIQRKSVGEVSDLLTRLERAAGDPAAILLIDQEMAEG